MVSKVKREGQGKHLTTHCRHFCSLHIYVHRPLHIATKFDMRTSLEECIPQDSHFQEEPPSAFLKRCMFISLFFCLVFISIIFLKYSSLKRKEWGRNITYTTRYTQKETIECIPESIQNVATFGSKFPTSTASPTVHKMVPSIPAMELFTQVVGHYQEKQNKNILTIVTKELPPHFPRASFIFKNP